MNSEKDTKEHIARVQEIMGRCVEIIERRAAVHDASKLGPEEKPFFDDAQELKSLTYGSPEYKAALLKLKPALDHHYKVNSHHPEHYDLYECDCGNVYRRHEVQPWHPDSDLRWCPACYPNGYPGFFETALIKKPGIGRMNLFDLLEMICDWKAATERHADGNLLKSFEINKDRFEISSELLEILISTALELFPEVFSGN